ncbi:YlzJ-like family protein [Aquibacillus saliphilus]|uniref:YlzJ-like family protein n=1 Tax=Aquibacillus saliphilus TaxID=1909422 RepID=UPI001CEFC623|nr:YlzJ-like family protein [Aquibacillus saliphilus]
MILYTPLSESDIYPTEQKDYDKCQTVNYQGRMVQVEKQDDGSFRILQLLSTDPNDYLDNSFTPGEII